MMDESLLIKFKQFLTFIKLLSKKEDANNHVFLSNQLTTIMSPQTFSNLYKTCLYNLSSPLERHRR